jgi:hypothetical protein
LWRWGRWRGLLRRLLGWLRLLLPSAGLRPLHHGRQNLPHVGQARVFKHLAHAAGRGGGGGPRPGNARRGRKRSPCGRGSSSDREARQHAGDGS